MTSLKTIDSKQTTTATSLPPATHDITSQLAQQYPRIHPTQLALLQIFLEGIQRHVTVNHLNDQQFEIQISYDKSRELYDVQQRQALILPLQGESMLITVDTSKKDSIMSFSPHLRHVHYDVLSTSEGMITSFEGDGARGTQIVRYMRLTWRVADLCLTKLERWQHMDCADVDMRHLPRFLEEESHHINSLQRNLVAAQKSNEATSPQRRQILARLFTLMAFKENTLAIGTMALIAGCIFKLDNQSEAMAYACLTSAALLLCLATLSKIGETLTSQRLPQR